MIRTMLLFAYVAAGDAVLVLIGLPLQRYALHVALYEQRNTALILLLLAANIALLLLVLSSALAGLAGMRRTAKALVRFGRKRG